MDIINIKEMKKIMLLITMLLLVSLAKAQHIDLLYQPANPWDANYVTDPTVWLDGDSVRFSMNVLFPSVAINLIGSVEVWLGSYCGTNFYTNFYDLYWTNANRPCDTEKIYSGAIYVGDFSDGQAEDINYGALFDTDDGPLGVGRLVTFRYYSY